MASQSPCGAPKKNKNLALTILFFFFPVIRRTRPLNKQIVDKRAIPTTFFFVWDSVISNLSMAGGRMNRMVRRNVKFECTNFVFGWWMEGLHPSPEKSRTSSA